MSPADIIDSVTLTLRGYPVITVHPGSGAAPEDGGPGGTGGAPAWVKSLARWLAPGLVIRSAPIGIFPGIDVPVDLTPRS